MAYPAPELDEWRGRLLNGLLCVSLALAFFLRRPFLVLVLLHIAMPWVTVGLAASFPGDFTLSFPKKGAPRAGLSIVWMFIAFCSLLVFDTARIVSWQRAVCLGCLPGTMFFAAVILVQKRCRVRSSAPGLIALLLFSVIYGYGLVRELNILLDRSPATVYPTIVLKKSLSKSTYGLRFAPWGSADGADSIHVTSSLYHSIHSRERICMVVKEGALGMSWYTAQACPWNGKIEFP